MEGLGVLLGGLALVVVPAAAILGPILYSKRLVLHVRLVDGKGAPQAGVEIRGIRNREVRAMGATGSGHVVGRQLSPTTDKLGVSNQDGIFLNTYYFRSLHTLIVGSGRMAFVDPLIPRMSLAKPAVIDVTQLSQPGAEDDPFDFTGRKAASKRGKSGGGG